jgi:hypothetical protein
MAAIRRKMGHWSTRPTQILVANDLAPLGTPEYMRLTSTTEEGICEFATSVPRLGQLVTRPMLGFKSFDAAQSTLVGIELMHMLRKGQLDDGLARDLTLAEQFYSLAA